MEPHYSSCVDFILLPSYLVQLQSHAIHMCAGIVRSLFETKIDVRIEQDQLHEREQYILELEMKLNDKDRELNALKIDHQTVSDFHFYVLQSS